MELPYGGMIMSDICYLPLMEKKALQPIHKPGKLIAIINILRYLLYKHVKCRIKLIVGFSLEAYLCNTKNTDNVLYCCVDSALQKLLQKFEY